MLTIIEIGERIAVARKMKNFSQAQLAGLLAVSAQAVGKWERGESMPDIIMFGRLSEILGVDLNYFNGGQEISESVPSVLSQSFEERPEEITLQRPGWNMSGGNWVDADFSGLYGLAERFSGANIDRCRFVGSELSGLTLKGNNIGHSDFTRSDLRGCKFSNSNLENDIFAESDFSDSVFLRSNIKNCDFSGANLTKVLSKWSHCQKINLYGAVLHGTAFQW